jgi:hypothetical protein
MQGRTLFMRCSGVGAITAVSAAALWSLGPAAQPVPVARAAAATPACAGVNPATEAGLMRTYRNAGSYRATQWNTAQGTPARVAVRIPAIAFTGPGQSSTLPVGPCQTIYRSIFSRIRARHHATASPFKYVEVDWNTEGLPRGPQNSFVSPHFDFHFYTRQKSWIDKHLQCGTSNGKTCDPQKTSYAQMRRFLLEPPPADVPSGYFADTGSSIPEMGLHLLDGHVHYSIAEVNQHPVLLYGSYDGRVLFAEASVTQYNLEDAMRNPSHTLSYVYRQPRKYQHRSWPTRFTITYDPRTRGFTAAFTDIRTH